ncbi:MAG: signal peptidase I, partial [bacterium]|nr:signal peptidase I [bacterium]
MAKSQQKRTKNPFREYAEAILVAVIAAFILRIFVVQAFRIPTGSMKDTLLVGDFLLVNKFIYGVRTPDRIPLINVKIPYFRLPAIKEPEPGEIIVFKYPLDEKLDYIKRCIAVGGQTLEIRQGVVYIDGKP